jgi:hypothetical protein
MSALCHHRLPANRRRVHALLYTHAHAHTKKHTQKRTHTHTHTHQHNTHTHTHNTGYGTRSPIPVTSPPLEIKFLSRATAAKTTKVRVLLLRTRAASLLLTFPPHFPTSHFLSANLWKLTFKNFASLWHVGQATRCSC